MVTRQSALCRNTRGRSIFWQLESEVRRVRGLAITSLPLWFASMMTRDHEALADGFLPDSETGVCNSSFGDEKLVSNDDARDRERRGGVLCYTRENHQRGRAG